jgi:Short C-terminal domain/Phospholipase_D-nuclease N-terminal
VLAEWVFGSGLSLILMIGVAVLWIGGSAWAVRDIVRRDDLKGKAGWILVGLIPIAGPFIYAIARPKKATLDRLAEGRTTGSVSYDAAEEITRLGYMRSRGEISDEEYERRRRQVLSGGGHAQGDGGR